MVGGRRGEPLSDAVADVGGGHVEFADGAEESGDVLVEDLFRRGGGCDFVFDVDTAAVTEFGPALTFELAISGADGIGVDAEAACEFARAGEAVAGAEVSREDGKGDLRHQLAVDRDFAGGREPEAHGNIVSGRKGTREQGKAGIRD